MKDRASRKKSGQSGTPVSETVQGGKDVIAVDAVADLVVDIWRIVSRARGAESFDRVLAASERAEDRLRRFGFEVVSLAGRSYDPNMQVKVIEHEECDQPLMIAECLSPAIYYNGDLIRPAEVVTKGN